MAANDTLKIAVQVVEDEKKSVESLVKKVQLMLDKDFKLKVSDDAAVKKLEDMLSVLKQIQQEMGNLSGHLGKDTWGKLSQNTQDAIVSINKLASELERLDTKFAKTFGTAMGTAWAKEMKKGEQGAKEAGDAAKKAAHDENELSTAIAKTSSSVAQCTTMLNRMVESSREAGSATHGIVENMRSMDVAGKRLAQIDSILAQISKRTISSQALGFDIGHLERMAEVLRKTRAEFLQVFMGRGYAEIPGLGMMDANSLAANRLYETQTTAIQKEMKAVDELAESMRRLQDIQRSLTEKANGGHISDEMRTRLLAASEEIRATMQKMAGPRVETSAEVNTALKEQIRGYEQLSKEASRASDEETKGNERVRKSLNDLLTLINDLNNRMKDMKAVGVESSKIQSLQQTINTIQAAYDRLSGMGGTSGGRFIKTAVYDENHELYRRAVSDANQAIREQTRETRENERAKRDAAKAADKLSAEEKKLADAMKQTNQHGFLQTNVLNDLKSMATQYLSIWGAKSFVENMAQITGELEMQQKSLEVIIGSASYASQLFGEIRDLSQQSPYTFQDLLKSTRQLAAFGIETKDLYGTMKSLSDIGAGLSVDVQRLILAYGHTKSYGYLSGIQNRQFETAGIDLVGALADRYNKLADAEERAGRAAEHVTRKDVFKMISKKEVGFEDVNAVIMGLDAPGGRFYNMQERQFETLGGKLRNLRNNYNIMMAEMGKANHGMLMSGVNMLNELTEHWDKYARIITAILVPLGALRLATLALNTAMGVQTNIAAKNATALLRQGRTLSAMQIASSRNVGVFSAIGMGFAGSNIDSSVSTEKMSKVWKTQLKNGEINKVQLRYLSLNKNLTESMRVQAGVLSGLTLKQAQYNAQLNKGGRLAALFRLRMVSLGASLRSFGAAIASMAIQMAPMAIIGSLVALYSHFKSMSDEAKSSLDQLANNAKEDAKSIDEVIGRYSERGVSRTEGVAYLNGNRILGTGLSFDIDKLKSMTASDLDDLKQELQKFSPFYEGDLVDIGKLNSQAEQVMAIMRKLDSYRHSEQVLAATADSHANAADGVFGWLFGLGSHESFITNLEDMNKVFKIMRSQVDSFSEQQIDEFDKSMGGELTRIMKSGAAVSLAEALKVKLVQSLSMSSEDRKKMIKSWNNSDLTNLFKRRQIFARSSWTKTGLASAYRGDFSWNVQRLSKSLQGTINANFAKDDIDGALKYAIEAYEAFASQAKGLSEDVKQYGLEMVLQSVFGNGGKFGIGYNEYLNKRFAGEVNSEIERSNLVNLFMSPEEITQKTNEVVNNIKERWKAGGKDISNITQGTIDDIVNAVLHAYTVASQWQNTLLGKNQSGDEKTFWEGFAKLNSKDIIDSKSEAEFWDAVRKKYKELQEKLEREKKVMQVKFGINLTPEIFMDSQKILEQMKKLNTNGQFYKDKNGKWQVSHKNTGAAYDEYVERYLPLMNTFSDLYYDAKGAEKRNVQLWDDKNKKNGGHGTYKDRESEVWEQRIKLIQEARREYDYWEKQIGKDAAQEKVKNQFENLVGADKVLKPGDLDNLERYADVLREINDEISARYQRDQELPAGQKKDVNISNDIKNLRELDNALYNIGKGEFERGAEDLLAGLTFRLEELSRQWEIFNAVRSSSGDAALASRLTGISPGATPADLKRFAISQFAGRQIDFDSVLGMNDEQIEDYVHGLGVSEEKIKSIVNGLKEWSKAQKDQTSSDIQNYAKWLGSLVDLESIRMRNADEYSNTLEEINRLEKAGTISGSEAARRRSGAASALETKNWQATSMYYNLYNNAHAMSRAEFGTAYNAELSSLKDQFDNGVITLQQYTEKVAQLNSVAREFGESGFLGVKGGVGAFLGGGVQGLASYYQQRSNKARSESKKSGDEADMEADMWQKRADSLLKMQHAAEQVVAVFNELAGVSDTLAGMFDALGMEGASNAMSDAGGILSGIAGGASSMAALGPYGMMAGAAIGAATSFAQLNDKRAERRIQKLSNEIGRISNTLDLIRSMREKELGYSRGRNIRALYSQYAGQSRSAEIAALMRSGNYATAMILLNADKASNAMREYYGNAIGDGSDSQYAMEYNLLLDQRKKKMQQYNEEAGKKKQDEGKLDEYKKEIAELDAQIQDFAENLMNELWGIDFKGWASQISDALMTAFENGTSLAKAFDESVTDILRNMSREMLNLAVVEPFMEKIRQSALQWAEKNQDMLFNNPQEAGTELGNLLGNEFRAIQEPLITAYQQAAQGLNDTLGQSGGWDLRNKGKSSGSGSNSVSQTITEDTAGFMTGILAAMHQDGSVRRLQLQTLVGEQVPNIIEMMTVSGDHIAGIDENTRAIMRMMQDGSGRMYERIDYIGTKLDRFANGFDRVTLR